MAKMTYSGNLGYQRPAWLADFVDRSRLAVFPAKVDASAFSDAMAVLVRANGIAAISATSVTIDALTLPGVLPEPISVGLTQVLIPAGTVLWFGGTKYARLTADAKAGDTTLSVAALAVALADNDEARYSQGTNRVTLLSGTPVGRTYAERDTNTPFGPADLTTPDDEIYLLAFDVPDARENNDVELVEHATRVKENYLPFYSTYTAPQLAAIRTRYRCFKGVD